MDQPESYQKFGEFLAVTWQDGHESLLSQESLRRACPCANCRGEPDLLGRRLMPADKPDLTTDSYRLSGLKEVGHYAWQLLWADGHSTGIYTYDYLRRLCDCDICLKNAPSGD